MGLDINAYSGCELIQERAPGAPWDERLGDREGVISVYPWDAREDRLDGRPPGYYRFTSEFFCKKENPVGHTTYGGFRAGSYSGYNRWREWLCRRALGVEPNDVWTSPDRYREQPFFALIHFSDAEGAIGPETSARLAADFLRWRKGICEGEDEYYVTLYDTFAAAFAFAADEGFVIFH